MSNFKLYIATEQRTYPSFDLTAVPGFVYDFGTIPVPLDGRWATSAGPATGVFDNTVDVMVGNVINQSGGYVYTTSGSPTVGNFAPPMLCYDLAGNTYGCVGSGNPGTWVLLISGAPGSFARSTSVLSDVLSTVTSAGALTAGKHNPVNATGGSKAMTLADAGTAGQLTTVEKTDSSTNTVTITLNLRGTPSSTLTLYWQNESIELLSKADGSWWPIAGHKTKAALDAAYAGLTTGNVAGLHKNTDSPTYGSWFTHGNAPGSMGGAATGTPAEGWAPLVAFQKFGDSTGLTNAAVTKTTQAVSFVAAYYGPTTDDSAEAGSAAVLLKDTGTGFTQGKKVTGWESDVQIEGSNTVTGANTYCLTGGGRLVMNGSSNTDTGYGWKVSAATGNNSLISTGTVGTWHGFRDDLYNPAGTSRSSSESVHGLNRITSEQSFYLSRSGFSGFAQMDLAGSDDSNAALFRIVQPSGTSRTVNDGAIASGSRKLSSATLNPTSADIGKTITVAGAGAAGGLLTAKVLSYLSDGTTILNTAASTTVASGAQVVVTETDLVGLRITQGSSGLARPIEIYDNTGVNVAGVSRIGAIFSRNTVQALNGSGNGVCQLVGSNGAVQPGTPTGFGGKIFSGSGAPGTISGSAAGDIYIRTDTPTTANQRIYMATAASTWSGIV